MFDLPGKQEGILPIQWLQKAAHCGVISSEKYKVPDSSFQPASLDLRLGEKAYRLRCSFLPGAQRVQDKLGDYLMGEVDLRDGAILETNRPYLIPLIEELRLPGTVYGRTNPRSSTGRLDIFTRVISDHSYRFDEIGAGYKGKLYLELASRSFTIKVRTGLSLNQLRLIQGKSKCRDEEVRLYHAGDPLLFFDGSPVPADRLSVAEGLFLSVDLSGDDKKLVGYRSKKNSSLLDLACLNCYSPEDFWEPIRAERKRRLVLEPEEFYLLLSAEKVRIPPALAAEMAAYDPTSGELRTHYAGFFDPGFGYDAQGLLEGTRAVMEVRAHDVPFMIESQQKVSKLGLERMVEPPSRLYGAAIGSSYQHQELTLSKHFRAAGQPAQPSLF